MVYIAMGNYAEAEPIGRQALEIRRIVLGEGHPDYSYNLRNLAFLLAPTNRAAEALSSMKKASAIDDRMLGQVFSLGPERQRQTFLAILQSTLHGLISLVLEYLSTSEEAVQAAFDLVLRRKAIGAEALAAQRDAVLRGRYPELRAKLQD